MGHNVHCIDINKEKIENLNKGIIPIYEPGLDELVLKNVQSKKLFFTSDYSVIEFCEAVFSAVGTPSDKDGSADLQYVKAVAKEFAKNIKKRSIFITKSTVPVGTAEKVRKIISDQLKKLDKDIEFDIVSNPEFLKEGTALDDFMNPDRIVIGCDTEYAHTVMQSIINHLMMIN